MIELKLVLNRPGFALSVALQLPAHGVTALVGPSGCGKTTVLRAVAGLVRAQGRVQVGAQTWQDDAKGQWLPTHQRPLGYVIQDSALFDHLDVRANIHYGRRRAGPAATGFDLDGLIELLGLGSLLHRRPASLSGGERQRVAMARALASGPSLLLMDEPLAALDAQRKAEILPYLEKLIAQRQLPMLYVTHALDEAARLADHLVLMQAGQVTADGPLLDMLSRPDLPLARLDEAGVVLAAKVDAHDERYGLSRIAVPGGALWLGLTPAALGATVRARVLARDVSVARVAPQGSSVINVLPVVLQAMQAETHTVLLQLRLSGAPTPDQPDAPAQLLARITRRSADTLGLQVGDALFAQVKGVALM